MQTQRKTTHIFTPHLDSKIKGTRKRLQLPTKAPMEIKHLRNIPHTTMTDQ